MVKHIIIIDDSEFKRDSIRSYMEKIFPDADIAEFAALNPGLRAICMECRDRIKERPDEYLIITDMVMPVYEREMPERNAGFSVLAELSRCGMSCPAIIVSSDEADMDRAVKYYGHTLGAVKHDISVWQLDEYRRVLKDLM